MDTPEWLNWTYPLPHIITISLIYDKNMKTLHSNFQVYNSALLPIATMLCLIFPELTHNWKLRLFSVLCELNGREAWDTAAPWSDVASQGIALAQLSSLQAEQASSSWNSVFTWKKDWQTIIQTWVSDRHFPVNERSEPVISWNSTDSAYCQW